MEIRPLGEVVRKAESDDKNTFTTISKYVNFQMRDTIDRIDAYLNSKHISGNTDTMGREKPFFNIVTSAVNIWYRATDIDRKNITIKPTRADDVVKAFLGNIILKEWMRDNVFGIYLNDWGRTLSRYGSAVSKFVEKNGKLHADVIPWNRLIVDPVDFDNNIRIEKLWFTPAQLRKEKSYDQEMVKRLLDDITYRKTMDGQKKDNKNDFIPLYEIHGELPLSYLTDEEEDEEEYVQQMHVITFLEKKDNNSEFEDYSLVRGREKKDPYVITNLIKEDGRTLSIGAVEHLFEPQWMTNHSQKLIKDQLDLASKIFFQTSDGNFVGQNAIEALEIGDILIHEEGKPLTQLNNTSNDLSQTQSFQQQWETIGNKINGISEAMAGAAAKSGTAWRQTQAELAEAHSLFELMIENKGLSLELMLREHIIPYIIKQLDTTDEVSSILEEHNVTKLDAMFVPSQAKRIVNNQNAEAILNGEAPLVGEEQDLAIAEEEQNIQGELNKLGNQRFIKPSDIPSKTWKQVFDNYEWEAEIDITGENKDSAAALATYSTVLQTLAGLAGQPMSPEMRMVFNKILNEAGNISPIELSLNKTQSAPIPQEGAAVGAVPNQVTPEQQL